MRDRIETLEHNETFVRGPGGVQLPKTQGQKGETVFRQITWNTSGEIATGIYYYVVVSETPGSEGKIQRGAFVVIK